MYRPSKNSKTRNEFSIEKFLRKGLEVTQGVVMFQDKTKEYRATSQTLLDV